MGGREFRASDWTNTKRLKITQENVLPLLWHCKWLDVVVFLDKDDKP